MFQLLTKKEKLNNTIESLLQEDSYHEWIRSDKNIYRFFREIMLTLSKEDFKYLNESKKLTFIYSSGKFASTISDTSDRNYIIIYPEMINLIKSVDNTMAFAIIFHELGHIIYKHFERSIPDLDKQIEADSFACKYGFKMAIIALLKEEGRTFESIARINSAREFQDQN